MSNVFSFSRAMGRLTVGQQLACAFISLLALLGAIGAIALYSVAQVNQKAESLSEKWLHGVGQLATARAAMLSARDFEVKHSHTSDRSYHAEYEDKIKEANALVRTQLDGYKQRVDLDVERSLFLKLSDTWAAYAKAADQIQALGRSGKPLDAAEISDGLGSMAVDEAIGALDRLSQFNFEGANTASTQAQQVFQQSQRFIVGLMVVALLMAWCWRWQSAGACCANWAASHAWPWRWRRQWRMAT